MISFWFFCLSDVDNTTLSRLCLFQQEENSLPSGMARLNSSLEMQHTRTHTEEFSPSPH